MHWVAINQLLWVVELVILIRNSFTLVEVVEHLIILLARIRECMVPVDGVVVDLVAQIVFHLTKMIFLA
jgi:hypothetical protein